MSTGALYWIKGFHASIRRGKFPDDLSIEQFNDVLKWLLGQEFGLGSLLTDEFRGFFKSTQAAREHTLHALDDMLFVGTSDVTFATLGLPRNVDISVAKSRYKRLMQVYHPDRNLASELGLSNRAEQLSLAYANIKNSNTNTPLDTHFPGYQAKFSPQYPDQATTAKSAKFNHRYGKVRAFMGSAPQFKRRVLLSSVVVASLFLLSIYTDSRLLKNNSAVVANGLKQENLDDASNAGILNAKTQSVDSIENEGLNIEEDKAQAVDNTVSKQASSIDNNSTIKEDVNQQLDNDRPVDEAAKIRAKLASLRKGIGKIQYFKLEDFERAKELAVSVRSASQQDQARKTLAKQEITVVSTPVKSTQSAAKKAIVNNSEKTKKRVIKEKESVASTPKNQINIKQAVAANTGTAAPENKPAVSSVESTKYATDSFNLAVDSQSNPAGEITTGQIVVEQKQVKPAITDDTVEMQVQPALTKLNETQAPPVAFNNVVVLSTLNRYANGMHTNDLDEVLSQVNNTVTVDNELVSKSALRNIYSGWLADSTNRKYKFFVKNITLDGGIYTVKGHANIQFYYNKKAKKKFKGPLAFDFKLIDNKPLIVAIRS